MPGIKPTSIRDLKNRVSILDVVSRVATLKKAGSRYKGLCPFHQEKTPSFHVDPGKGFYKCFGCGKAGDIISFVTDSEGLNFVEAVETLAQRFGVALEYEEGAGAAREDRSLRQELFDLHEQAAEHFHTVFKTRGGAGDFMREYWTESRRFPSGLADEFKIGATDEQGSGLAGVLMKQHHSEEALRQCGLFFVRGDLVTLGSLKPRFRGRLMIPIRDHQGRVVAFTARQTGLTPKDDPSFEAKYVNSPETPIFTKSNLLFNLDRARQHVGEGHPFVLVEGQLDALRCWHVGLKTAIAPQGTSITEGQLALLRRYLPQVECFLDGDAAGQKASLRFLPMALKAGLEVKFLVLPPGVDPDSLFREQGLPAYEGVRAGALSAMAFACQAALPDPGAATAEQKSRAAQTLHELVVNAESEVARAGFLDEIARHLRLPLPALQRDFHAFAVKQARQNSFRPASAANAGAASGAPAPPAAKPVQSVEDNLLYLCLHFNDIATALLKMLHRLPHDWIDATSVSGAILNRFSEEFVGGHWPDSSHLEALLETADEKALVASLLFDPTTIENPVKVANEGLRDLQVRAFDRQLRQIELEIARKGTNFDAEYLSLLKRRVAIIQENIRPLTLPLAG